MGIVDVLMGLLSGGFARGYRTQILGGVAFLGGLASWAVGDWSFHDLVTHLPIMAGGLGLTTLGAKINNKAAAEGIDLTKKNEVVK